MNFLFLSFVDLMEMDLIVWNLEIENWNLFGNWDCGFGALRKEYVSHLKPATQYTSGIFPKNKPDVLL
jgi:hypothetical protein